MELGVSLDMICWAIRTKLISIPTNDAGAVAGVAFLETLGEKFPQQSILLDIKQGLTVAQFMGKIQHLTDEITYHQKGAEYLVTCLADKQLPFGISLPPFLK